MGELDQGAKKWLELCAPGVLEYIWPGVKFIKPLVPEVAAEPQLVMDSLFLVELYGVRCVVDIEVQTQVDPEMPHRLYEYGSRASSVYNFPATSVVFWLERKGTVPQPPYQMYIGPMLQATWNFINVEVYNLPASDILQLKGLGLVPLVPFMQGATVEVVTEAMRRVKEEAPADQTDELAFLLAAFIARAFEDDELARSIVRRFYMNTDILEQSPLYQSMVKESLAKERNRIARIALEGRFGALSEDVIQALAAADEATVISIMSHIASDSLEQVRERLGLARQ